MCFVRMLLLTATIISSGKLISGENRNSIFRLMSQNVHQLKVKHLQSREVSKFQCSLLCSKQSECMYIGVRERNICQLYAEGTNEVSSMKYLGNINQWLFFKKDKHPKEIPTLNSQLPPIKIFEPIIFPMSVTPLTIVVDSIKLMTTTSTQVCSKYYTGPTCSQVKDLKEMMLTLCEGMGSGFIPIFDKIANIFKWRCHDPTTLTDDKYFFKQGTEYTTVDTKMQSLIDKHPDIIYQYYIAANGDSCATKCKQMTKTCEENLTTLDSIYLFYKAGGINCDFDKTPNGKSFWNSENTDPHYQEQKCMGFIGARKTTCAEVAPDTNMRRLCRCN